MKKTLVAGALVGGVLSLGGVAGADLDISSHPKDVHREVWLYADSNDASNVEIDADGGAEDGVIEAGDRNVFTETLYRVHDSKPVGEAYGHGYIECTVLEVLGEQPPELSPADLTTSEHTDPEFDAAIQCTGTLDLDHNRQLYVQTLIQFSDFLEDEDAQVRGGVLGGTGALAGASGQFELREVDEEGDSIYKITLLK